MKILFATDHAGFELKEKLVKFVRGLGHEVEDLGAHELDLDDDYPDFISKAARAVSDDPENTKAIILGASGQGEALVANRFPNVRAGVYYGEPPNPQTDATGNVLGIISSMRTHGNSNVLSLGVRFVSEEDAKSAVKKWLNTAFSGEERHVRRIKKIDVLQ